MNPDPTLPPGGILLFDTDTVPGFGIRPDDPAALEALYRLKGRDENKPLALYLPDTSVISMFAIVSPANRERILATLPGPFTLLLPARPGTPPEIAPRGVLGLRIIRHPAVTAALRAAGGALLGTSANRSGTPTPPRASAVDPDLRAACALVFESREEIGPSSPSTLVDCTVEPPRLLRAGPIPVPFACNPSRGES